MRSRQSFQDACQTIFPAAPEPSAHHKSHTHTKNLLKPHLLRTTTEPMRSALLMICITNNTASLWSIPLSCIMLAIPGMEDEAMTGFHCCPEA